MKKMLSIVLICPSRIPLSSMVLLVKKFDGSWHFYMDYQILNEITIKDKFLIHITDELFDELYGPTYYSKLDVRLVTTRFVLKMKYS